MGKSKVKKRYLSIEQQVYSMRARFPQFQFFRRKDGPTWQGMVRTSEITSEYVVKVVYQGFLPKVWIVNPEIFGNKHRYADGSLCLYETSDRSWHPNLLIADTIIPWTIEWLRLYELWLITGIWYGLEAVH